MRCAEKNKARYGEDYYKRLGQKGGQSGHKGGFYGNPELARRAGQKGGRVSKRGHEVSKEVRMKVEKLLITRPDLTYNEIAAKAGCKYWLVAKTALRIKARPIV